MAHEIDDIDDLIGKVLVGEASQEEQDRLQAWSEISVDNRRYVEEVRVIFERASSIQIQLSFDADSAWNKVKAKLRSDQNTQPPRNYGSFIRMAAGVVIALPQRG